MNGGEMVMAKDKKDIVQHGLNAAKANAADNQEQQYVEELSTELTGAATNKANKRAPKK